VVLETGFYYWYKHKAAGQWYMGYVYEDCEEMLWFLVDGNHIPMEQMDLEHFEFVKIEPPR